MSMTAVDFKDWYDKYFRMVYLFLKGYLSAKQISHSEKEVEDLVQNTFLSILERKSDKPIEFPAAYLKKTAISQVRIYYQRKNRVNFKEIAQQENIANEKHLHVLYYRAKIKLYNYFKNIK